MNKVTLFYEAQKRVSAYADFLKNKGFDGFHDNWTEIPIMNKSNYLKQYKIEKLCWDDGFEGCHLIGASSGFSSKGVFYWPKRAIDERDYLKLMEEMFRNYYHIDKRKTLFIVSLAFGAWIAGMQIAATVRQMAVQSDYELTVSTPGLNLNEGVDIYKQFNKHFDQVIWITNPSNINLIIHLFKKDDVKFKPGSIYFPVIGEYFPESFRIKIENFFVHKKQSVFALWTGYGSADTGDIAVENAAVIRLRKFLYADEKLSEKYFGTKNTPFIMQMTKESNIEIIDGKIIVSKDQLVPLIRYDTNDSGGIINKKELENIESLPADIYNNLPEKMIYIMGRSDNEVVFYGTNLNLEELNEFLNTLPKKMDYSGFFELEMKNERQLDVFKFHVHTGGPTDKESAEEYQSQIVGFLKEKSHEFAAKYDHLSQSAGIELIEVELHEIDPNKSMKKHKYIIKG